MDVAPTARGAGFAANQLDAFPLTDGLQCREKLAVDQLHDAQMQVKAIQARSRRFLQPACERCHHFFVDLDRLWQENYIWQSRMELLDAVS
jgi:hypothetical protein